MENDHGILSDHPTGEEENQVEITLRPQKLREYIGQPKIKHELEVYIKAWLNPGKKLLIMYCYMVLQD